MIGYIIVLLLLEIATIKFFDNIIKNIREEQYCYNRKEIYSVVVLAVIIMIINTIIALLIVGAIIIIFSIPILLFITIIIIFVVAFFLRVEIKEFINKHINKK